MCGDRTCLPGGYVIRLAGMRRLSPGADSSSTFITFLWYRTALLYARGQEMSTSITFPKAFAGELRRHIKTAHKHANHPRHPGVAFGKVDYSTAF